MTLVVEDGTALATAESFCSVAFADQYFSDRGNAAWAALGTPAKEAALRLGSGYMEQVYRLRWDGFRVTGTQGLSWPRYLVPQRDAPGGYRQLPFYYPQNIVPLLVQQACAELAVRASAGELAPDIGRLASREKIGPIETDYEQGAAPYTRYRAIDNMLRIFFKGNVGEMNLSMVRA